MKCPICNENIPVIVCEQCGGESPEDAKYCMQCGNPLFGEATQTSGTEDEFDIENRILCPDGTCTGIIVDGKCIECGRPYNGAQGE